MHKVLVLGPYFFPTLSLSSYLCRLLAFKKNAPSNAKMDFEAPTQESSPEIGPASGLVEAFEYGGDGVGDTANDVSDMKRLGKKQEFRVGQPSSRHLVRLTELR